MVDLICPVCTKVFPATYYHRGRSLPGCAKANFRRHVSVCHKRHVPRMRDGYLSTAEVAHALGTRSHRVAGWVRAGHLKAHMKSDVHLQWRIDENDVARFLRGYGGLINHLDPTDVWKPLVMEGRAYAAKTYISRAEISRLLFVAEGHVVYLKHQSAFPKPVFVITGGFGYAGSFYSRKEVFDWIVCHATQYDPNGKIRRRLLLEHVP